MKGLGKRLKQLRKEKNFSQGELAKILNIGRSAIALYETDARQPDPETIKLFADYFKVSADYLLDIEMQMSGGKIGLTVNRDDLTQEELNEIVKNYLDMKKKYMS